jgi:dolichyl-phosphate beta-glucosyltransferase
MRRLSAAVAPGPAGPPIQDGTPAVELSVVIPAFNEEQRIGASIEAVRAYLDQAEPSWELIVVDDGSNDGTAAVVEQAAVTEPRIRMIRTPRNRGKGHAVRVGALASRGRDVLISDADLSTPIAELQELRRARGSAVVAIGSRSDLAKIAAHQSLIRESLGRIGNWIIQAAVLSGICDTQCGFKLFDGPAARALFAATTVDGWAFDVEVLHLCRRFGWPVAEVPVRWAHAAGSKLRPIAYLQVLSDVARLRLTHRRTPTPAVSSQPIIIPPRAGTVSTW